MSLKEICDCDCDIATHFLDEEKIWDPDKECAVARKFRGACLGVRCDCGMYRPPGAPDPTKKPVRPEHASHCRCAGCRPFHTA